jgi:hypothetical protein
VPARVREQLRRAQTHWLTAAHRTQGARLTTAGTGGVDVASGRAVRPDLGHANNDLGSLFHGLGAGVPIDVCGGVARLDGEVDNVVAVRIDHGLITGLYIVRNPQKLSHMQRETTLRR